MKKLLALSVIVMLAVACKNILGNPYPKPAAPRLTPVSTPLRVEPANWWVGMRHNRVELMIYQKDIASFAVRLGPSKGVRLASVEPAENPNYLFVTLDIRPEAPPQTVPIIFTKEGAFFTHAYPLLPRSYHVKAQGVNSKDIIYLIFPDRFANGDPGNDNVSGMHQGLQRDSLSGRHGGDLKGVLDHLDYLKDLGMTAIWLNPELENDQKEASYHGYALTDHYRVDRRMGANDQLRELAQACHQRGMKLIRDVVLNHIGNGHWWMADLPSRDWVNQWPAFTRTTYRAPALVDPYASEWDKKHFNDGWFDVAMPDLNQRNPHLATYLIQQAIWWVEYAELDDFRIDTYTYSDQAFCSRWCRELRDEYPQLNLFGEVWEHTVAMQSFFADDQPIQRANFDSNLPGIVDFQLCFAIREALSREQGWTEGISKVYYTLAADLQYKDPLKNVIMLDNHDMTRFFSAVKEDIAKFRSGVAFLMTTRGTPQIYYATEILGTGFEWPSHGNIRKDFPGGWPGDAQNKFTAEGRTAQENEAFQYLRTLARYRNQTPALQTGKLMQFTPENGVYTYFRYDAQKCVMVLLNTSNQDQTVDLTRFSERLKGFGKAKEITTGQLLDDLSGRLDIAKNSPLVFELML